jgi:dienelactone hydrolase
MIDRILVRSRWLATLSSLAILGGVSFSLSAAEPSHPQLPNTELLVGDGDFASQIVDEADKFLLDRTEQSVNRRSRHWQRDFSSPAAYAKSIEPNRARLARIVGVREARVPPSGLELQATTDRPALLASGSNYEIFVVAWPAFGDVQGEGLLLVPTGRGPVADVVAIPDCNQTPEQLVGLIAGVPAASQYARRLAESGCRVIVPALINRADKKDPLAFRDRLSQREWAYRQAYEMGRGLIGYEVQKVLAAVDWFEADARTRGAGPQGAGREERTIGVIGWGEGGLLALYSGALDERISVVCTSGYFDNRNDLWQEPVDRNLFGLLEEFGDAELASLVAPRKLLVEAAMAPQAVIAPGGRGAPGRIVTPKLASVEREVARARQLVAALELGGGPTLVVSNSQPAVSDGSGPYGSDAALNQFLAALGSTATVSAAGPAPHPLTPLPDAKARHDRQLHELDRHTQGVLAESPYVRKQFVWDKLNYESLEKYAESTAPLRRYFADEVIGRCDEELPPPHVRSRWLAESDQWTRYEVVLDALPGVIAYGLLTLPKGIAPDEKRPVVVCQHGLGGRPQDTIGEPNFKYYDAFATKLAERGFITFAPQNLYIFDDRFRSLQRKANPLKLTLFSIITVQHQAIVDWLQTLPQVAPERIAFYGLSYGGKTAMRVPALVTDYCLSICSGDFNEWIEKNASIRRPSSYMHTPEYEMFEFDLGNTFDHAEMAALIAPRPFMVERGHFDGVGTDEAVGAEYAKVRHLYAGRLGIATRTEIEWFVGPHKINGQGTFEFLHRQLDYPGPK